MNTSSYSLATAIQWGELVQQAYDMYEGAPEALVTPIPQKPGLPAGWSLAYYLSVEDEVLFFEENSLIGYIVTEGTRYGIVIRGTEGTLEWVEDVEAIQQAFNCRGTVYGNVESGFLQEFGNISVVDPATGKAIGKLPGWLGTLQAGSSVVVAGHSLGAAVATLVGAQTAIQGLDTTIYSYASPQVGDSHFAAMFDGLPLDHYRIFNIHDLVPKVPNAELGYYPVDIAIPIDSDTGKIKTNVACFHSLRTYLAVLGSTIYDVEASCAITLSPQ